MEQDELMLALHGQLEQAIRAANDASLRIEAQAAAGLHLDAAVFPSRSGAGSNAAVPGGGGPPQKLSVL